MAENKKVSRRFWKALGPGLITGAADDDPSGIATYSQAGAQFGYGLTWTVLLTLPLMAAIQIISARIGWQTGHGLTRSIARHMPRPVVVALVALLVVANTTNIAADLAAMGQALTLVMKGPSVAYALLFGVICLAAEIFIPYHRYAGFLKFLTVTLLVYVAVAFSVDVPWSKVLVATLLPTPTLDPDAMLMIVALLGTTISPYLFFWQASQEAEESRLSHRHEEATQPEAEDLSHISIDTWIGMAASSLVAFFIIVTTAATLHANGVTEINSAAEAAEALRPIAGDLTFLLFALGIIGTGLLAVPVLAGSAAYAVAEIFALRGSLELPLRRARGFYAVVGIATLAGAALAATGLDAMTMLFWAAVINGVVAVPIMLAMMLVVSAPQNGDRLALPAWLRCLGWLASAAMALALLASIWSYVA
ncbi:MAG: divalent metal cation transporter [Alphaproteobacteria bacterium]|nr:divalent metal cation transporter [Alphaproteobacteria bacterium]